MTADLPPESPVELRPLPYEERLAERPVQAIDLVVIHCTELPDLATAREYGERELHEAGTGNSGHIYIDRDGSLHLWVRPQRVAHHTRGYNPRSIGIEIVNRGRYPHWLDSRHQSMDEPYTEAQVLALIAWLQRAKSELPGLRYIAGHEDLDTARVPASDDPALVVPRKRDPGPQFPWERVLRETGLERIYAEPVGQPPPAP
jgi:N-acetylmuramoyl-L-alanine amidase